MHNIAHLVVFVLSLSCIRAAAPPTAAPPNMPNPAKFEADYIQYALPPRTPQTRTMLAPIWSITSTELSSHTYLATRDTELQHFITEASSKQYGPSASTPHNTHNACLKLVHCKHRTLAPYLTGTAGRRVSTSRHRSFTEARRTISKHSVYMHTVAPTHSPHIPKT